MSTQSSGIAHLSVTPEGKVEIDLPRAFTVRRYAAYSAGVGVTYTEQIVWAHSYAPVEGSLLFSLYKAKLVKMQDPVTHAVTEQEVAMQTFCCCMAPGTWYDVVEAVMVQPKANARAN